MLKKRTIAIFVCCIYLFGIPAQAAPALNLTPPTQMVPISAIQSYPVLRGIEVDPEDPFHLKFIIDNHNQKVSKEEISTLIKYFLAGLTLSEEGLWVNLSPYEKDNIAPLALSQTDLGKELLSQDYTLKQLTSSLTYPESDTGKAYWNKVYQKTYQLKKTTNIPIDTYNKVWIVPKQAKVYETGNKAFITDATLSALAEEDYLALKQNNQPSVGNGHARSLHKLSSQIMQDTLLLHIEQDINQGKNFASLRQAYHSLILATWFKQKLKDSVYQYYLNQDKIKGIGLSDPQTKDKIYQQYLSAYKQGVYNYIKKDREPYTNRPIKRQYYSGGMQFAVAKAMMPASSSAASSALMRAERNGTTMVSVRLAASSASRTDQIKEAIALLDWLREPSQKFSQGRPADYDIKYDQLKARLAALGIDSGAQDKELAYILYQLPRKNSAQVLDEALESHTVKSNDSPGEASSAVTYEDVRQANQIHSAAAERYLESSRIYGRDDKRTKAANADKKRARKELVRVREEFEKSNPNSASSVVENDIQNDIRKVESDLAKAKAKLSGIRNSFGIVTSSNHI